MPSLNAPASRRRQRSTRLTVAAALILLSAAVVVGTVLTGSWLLVSVAAGASVVLGAAATRITHSELMTSRRDAARDRSEQAQAYRELTDERTLEQARFSTMMESRIAVQGSAIVELEGALIRAQRRAAEATRKMNSEARRADVAEQEGRALGAQLDEAGARAAEATLRVSELEQELDVLRAELAAWQTTPARRHA